MWRRSSSSSSQGGSMSATRATGARRGVPAPPRAANAAPGRARAAPARRHLPPRPPPDASHHTRQRLAGLGAGGAAPGAGLGFGTRRAVDRGERGESRRGAHSERPAAGRGMPRARPRCPGGPAAPARRAPRDSPAPAACPAAAPATGHIFQMHNRQPSINSTLGTLVGNWVPVYQENRLPVIVAVINMDGCFCLQE